MEDKIKSWIEKQGYPLEYQVADVLNQSGFKVIQSDYFKDPETLENREIDVCGFKQVIHGNTLVRFTIVVECKSGIEKPWLLFSNSKSNLGDKARVAQTPSTQIGLELLLKLCDEKKYLEMEVFSDGKRDSFGITECFTNGKDIPYSAIYSVAKATAAKSRIESSDKTFKICDIFIPIVVINAPLFEIYYEEEMKINKVDNGTLTWRNNIIDRPHSIIKVQRFDSFKERIPIYSKEIDTILKDSINNIIPNLELDNIKRNYDLR